MKKLNFISTILFSSFVYAGNCDSWSYRNSVDGVIEPTRSGKYVAFSNSNTYSNGMPIEIGGSFMFTSWEDSPWYKSNWISCSVTNIELKFGHDYGSSTDPCYLISLNCSVEERLQFYNANVKYSDLKGYRRNGSLKWTRDKVGSTDIYCYDKSGISVVKRVNDPQYCK